MTKDHQLPPSVTEATTAIGRLAAAMEREVAYRERTRRMVHLLLGVGAVFVFVLALYVLPRISDAFAEAYGRPHVAVLSLEGTIGGGSILTANRVVPMIAATCKNRGLQGLVVRIQSPGGTPADAERIGAAIRRCRAQVAQAGGREDLPVIAAIEGIGASAAYWIAIEADRIIATESTMVGSIGAVISYLEWSEAIARIGVTSHTYASGDLKAIFSPWRAPRANEVALGQDLVEDAMDVFRRKVQNRRPRTAEAPADHPLWSGRIWLGEEARDLGLIDDVGVLEDLLAAEFPGVPVRYSAPRRNLREEISAEAMVDAILRVAARPPMVTP